MHRRCGGGGGGVGGWGGDIKEKGVYLQLASNPGPVCWISFFPLRFFLMSVGGWVGGGSAGAPNAPPPPGQGSA